MKGSSKFFFFFYSNQTDNLVVFYQRPGESSSLSKLGYMLMSHSHTLKFVNQPGGSYSSQCDMSQLTVTSLNFSVGKKNF